MKSCNLNVKLFDYEVSQFYVKACRIASAYGANIQQVKLYITLAIKALVTNNLLCINACVFLFQHDHLHPRVGVGCGYWVGDGGTEWVISLSQGSLSEGPVGGVVGDF